MAGTGLLCGQAWFNKHQNDYTHEDIASLSITASIEGRELPATRQNGKRGIVKDLVKINRKEKR